MKYNIYSPLGRTGSVRLQRIIAFNFVHSQADHYFETGEVFHQALHLSETPSEILIKTQREPYSKIELPIIENGEFTKLSTGDYIASSNSYSFPESFYEIKCEDILLHSHLCTWAVKEDWTNVLSTRKNKSELPMSLKISARTGIWSGGNNIDDPHYNENKFYTDRPFHMPVEEYINNLHMLHLKEQMFLEGVKRDTGKDAIITYLEESYDEIEVKFDIKIPEDFRNELNTYKSKKRPKDYIINYDELIDAYNHYEYPHIKRKAIKWHTQKK